MSYQGAAKKYLDSQGIKIGNQILIKKDKVSYKGMLLDRSEDSDDQHIVLKMDSGYNVGVNIQNAELELLESGEKPKIELKPLEIEKNIDQRDISIISTGGTVASIIDYKTGAVHPAFTADDLLRATPELLDEANIRGKAIMNILSENMRPEYWIKAARCIMDEINGGAEGVIVAHGTDTMHYTSAALSFMIKSPVPIIITGAQRSSDRPSSDAYLNLMGSVTAAKSDIAEVLVCMHANEDDRNIYLHRGTKVRKMHTSRRDTFQSINCSPLAQVKDGNLEIKDKNYQYQRRGENDLEIKDSLEHKVAYIKSFPGISADYIDYHVDKQYKGILIEGTGLGHCPDNIIPAINRAIEEEIPVVMASQCLYGRTNLNVYSTGRNLLLGGVIPAQDMLAETAYVKLSWALGQTENQDEVKEIMQTNIAGEMEEKSSPKYFLNDYSH